MLTIKNNGVGCPPPGEYKYILIFIGLNAFIIKLVFFNILFNPTFSLNVFTVYLTMITVASYFLLVFWFLDQI